jgi:UPF0716 protein FxsA
VVVFLVVPLLELYVIAQVAGSIGLGETILLLIAISIAGAWLVRFTGLGVWRRLQDTVAAGRVPSGELVDGGLVLLAGALMITPGFLSDALGLLLLLPPSRAVARALILRRMRAGHRHFRVVATGARGPAGPADSADDVWDVEGWEDPPERPGLGP